MTFRSSTGTGAISRSWLRSLMSSRRISGEGAGSFVCVGSVFLGVGEVAFSAGVDGTTSFFGGLTNMAAPCRAIPTQPTTSIRTKQAALRHPPAPARGGGILNEEALRPRPSEIAIVNLFSLHLVTTWRILPYAVGFRLPPLFGPDFTSPYLDHPIS